MSARKKILVLESEQLLTASIASLLASQSELEVMKTTISRLDNWNNDNGLQPDVVILDEGLLADNMSDVIKLADRHPTLRLIVCRLHDGQVQIFDKQMVEVRHVSDFLKMIYS